MTLKVLIATSLLTLSLAASAAIETSFPQNERTQVGKSRFSYMFWDVYDATLFAPDGKWTADKPYMLSLHYLRDFDGEDIAKRSVKEMRGQGLADDKQLQQWLSLMASIFPDVREGDTLTGVVNENQFTTFYYNGDKLDTIDDKAFTQAFFSIWLSENTSEPEMRNELLGDDK